jgi:hypothetical protein
MTHHPILADIDAFLTAHGMKESTFGRKAVRDWKLVRELRNGRRLWPETEQAVRNFMVTYRPGTRRDERDQPRRAAA